MSNDGKLAVFDRALRDALSGESLDDLWARHADAAGRGDLERLRLLEQILQTAVALGNNAVVSAQSKRAKQ